MDRLQVFSCEKSLMDSYCTRFGKPALRAGWTPLAPLEVTACPYLYQLWRSGYPSSYLCVAVSAFQALEDMRWLLAFLGSRV